jgi:cytochrome P450
MNMGLYVVFYTFLGLFSFIIFVIYWKLIRSQKRFYDIFRNQGISCEPFIPIIGQLSDIRRASENDAQMNYRMELVRKHGYVYVASFGPSTRLYVMEPDMLADVFDRLHAHDYGKPADVDQVFRPLIGIHNLLVSEGEEHERARKMLSPAFHFVKLQSMVSIMIDQTSKTIDELLLLPTEHQVIDLQIELNTLTLSIIASSAFGKGFQPLADEKQSVCRTFTELLEAIQYRTVRTINQIPIISQLPFWRKHIVDRNSREISDFIDQIIADRRHHRSTSLSSSEDILDLLLSAVDTQGQPFSNQEIKDQALTFVLAGHETTGNLMTWTMYVLMINEQVLQACRDEVDRILPDGIEPTYEHVSELIVCEAILQETLRLYPPAPFISRKCIREHYIGSEGHRQIRVPAGVALTINTYALHRREEFWPRPNEFDYTRWIRDPVTGLKPKLAHPFCYLPFAAGSRNCIGQNFALLEAKVMLAMLVQRCNFELEPGQKIVPDVRITMRPKYGLRARITRRS